VKDNAFMLAIALMDHGFKVVSDGTDNHCMLVDLRTKFPALTGKAAENALVKADITVNKNMVPFDSRSPFLTSGIRIGTAALSTRGLRGAVAGEVADMIDIVLSSPESESAIQHVKERVQYMMKNRPLFVW